MMTAIYLILGLAGMGGLFYGLMQISARQQRLNAELTRLEQLSGEVSMMAGAMLEQVDMRIDYLIDMVEQVEKRIAPAPGPTPALTQHYQEVCSSVQTLADQGLDAGQIAERTGVPRGEVQLILNLRGRRAGASSAAAQNKGVRPV